jgi:hypothetical protein
MRVTDGVCVCLCARCLLLAVQQLVLQAADSAAAAGRWCAAAAWCVHVAVFMCDGDQACELSRVCGGVLPVRILWRLGVGCVQRGHDPGWRRCLGNNLPRHATSMNHTCILHQHSGAVCMYVRGCSRAHTDGSVTAARQPPTVGTSDGGAIAHTLLSVPQCRQRGCGAHTHRLGHTPRRLTPQLPPWGSQHSASYVTAG